MSPEIKSEKSMKSWIIIWSGQIISSIGTKMNRFAIAAWIYDMHKSAAEMALVQSLGLFAMIFIGIFAGVLLDRLDRKKLLIAADTIAAISSTLLLLLYFFNLLQVWHLYVLAIISGSCEAFIIPGLITLITSSVPKNKISRAHAMLTMLFTLGETVGNVLSGYLIAVVGISFVFFMDIISFTISIAALILVKLDQEAMKKNEKILDIKNFISDCLFGIKYIMNNKVLLALMLYFVSLNILGAAHFILQRPMILAITGSNTEILGLILSANGLGGFLGGLIMMLWGGSNKKAHLMIAGGLIYMLNTVIFALTRNLMVWIVTSFLLVLAVMILNITCYTIWQMKVPNEYTGRVFSTRGLIVQISTPLAGTVLGFLTDYYFEPLFNKGSILSNMIGQGPGSGIVFLIIVSGIIGIIIAASGFFIRNIREAETLLPDVIHN